MNQSQAVLAVCSALIPVLAAFGGAIRYLVQILSSIKTITDVAQHLALQLQSHIEASNASHAALADKVASHDTQLAVLHTKVGTTTPGGTA